MRDKAQLSDLINTSKVFELDPVLDKSAYEREKHKLIEHIYQYKLIENSEYEEYSIEIIEVVNNCLKYYSKDKGYFINYFNTSFKQRKRVEDAKRVVESSNGGVKYSKDDRELSRMIANLLKSSGLDAEDLLKHADRFADLLELSIENLRRAIEIYNNTHTVSTDEPIGDDDTASFGDTLKGGETPEEKASHKAAIYSAIEALEQKYNESREKTKKLLSIKLTNMMFEFDKDGDFHECIAKAAFFDIAVYEEINRHGKPLINKEIASSLGISESNLTQTWNRFIEKCRDEINMICVQ